MILTRLKYVLILPSFQSFVPEFIQLLSGKNTAELAVIAENLRVFRILRSLKMVSYLPVFWSWVSNSVKVIPLNLKRMYYPDFFKLGAKYWKNTMKDVFYGGERKEELAMMFVLFSFLPQKPSRLSHLLARSLVACFASQKWKLAWRLEKGDSLSSYLKPFRQQKWPLFLYYLSSGDQQKSLPPLMLQCYAQ